MPLPMHKNRSVNLHNFAMVPRADVPRSTFQRQSTHKTTFNSGYLIPIYVDEVLPGDSFSVRATIFARLSTPLYPVMDNLHLETQWFFVPLRLIWTNFVKMMGEQDNPSDSISYITPVANAPASGYNIGTMQDYMGLITLGQAETGKGYLHANLWPRAYNLIWNTWYRDENLQNSVTVDKGDGPDNPANYVLLRRGKRYDYFTQALPWPQKGATAVSVPLGTTAPVIQKPGLPVQFTQGNDNLGLSMTNASNAVTWSANATATGSPVIFHATNTGLQADLTNATAATINALRLAFATQKVLERDARGGTRYTEIIRSHFGVISPDARLQRPEYLGGGSTPVVVNPTVQTSGTSASGTTTPLGALAGVGAAVARGHGFTQSFTEHGVIIGLMSVRADLTYQQGVRRMWHRSTRYDYALPAFSHIGEQAVLQKEIYATGNTSVDDGVWGYVPRFDEYRYRPSMVTGRFRSTANGPLDAWHLAQKFTASPTLNSTFIQDTPPVSRVIAVTADSTNSAEFIMDAFFNERVARPLPMHGVPGFIDRF